MAPKGGGGRGGGGGGGRGGSSSISCDGPGFATTHSKVLIAFAAIFFVTYLVLSCIIPGRKKRTILNNGQPPAGKAKWLFLRLSILTAFLYVDTRVQLDRLHANVLFPAIIRSMLLFLASFTMTQCGSGSTETVNGVKIAELWFEEFSLITIFGVILIPLCKNLHDVSGNLVPKLVALGHSVYFVFLALLDLISVIILTAFYEVMRTGSSRDRDTVLALHTASKGVTAAFNVFALLGMGLAAVSMLLAVLRSSALKQGVSALVSLLAIVISQSSLTIYLFPRSW
jgi:preprotein translocase subunit SecG